jgi:hypothetical protein
MHTLADPKRITCSLVGSASLFQQNLTIPSRELIKKIKPFSFLPENELHIILSALEVQLIHMGLFIYNSLADTFILVVSTIVILDDTRSPIGILTHRESRPFLRDMPLVSLLLVTTLSGGSAVDSEDEKPIVDVPTCFKRCSNHPSSVYRAFPWAAR